MKERIFYFFIFMGLFSLSYFLGSIYTITFDEAASLIEEFENLIEDIDTFGIFSNNTSLALPMFIPGFGIAWGAFAAWSTGQVFSAIQVITPAMANFPSLALLYLSPFGALELFAYSLAMSRSFLFVKSVIRKSSLTKQIKPTIIEVAILIVVLFTAAVIEDYIIQNMEFFPEFMTEDESVEQSLIRDFLMSAPIACYTIVNSELQNFQEVIIYDDMSIYIRENLDSIGLSENEFYTDPNFDQYFIDVCPVYVTNNSTIPGFFDPNLVLQITLSETTLENILDKT